MIPMRTSTAQHANTCLLCNIERILSSNSTSDGTDGTECIHAIEDCTTRTKTYTRCECGKKIKIRGIIPHRKTKYHNKIMKRKTEQIERKIEEFRTIKKKQIILKFLKCR